MQAALESNIKKFFWYQFLNRRNFIPLVGVYFMTLPNAAANQIGLYTLFGAMAGFLLELPSGYISDKIGHKNGLLISRLSMILSLLFLVNSESIIGFCFVSIFLSIGMAFHSGTSKAFLYNSLEDLGRQDEFSEIDGKLSGKVSLLSIGFIVLLPFFTQIDILLPFYIALGGDFIALAIMLSMHDTKHHKRVSKGEQKSLGVLLKDSIKLGILPFVFFLSCIEAVQFSTGPFNPIYITGLGLPLIYVGCTMGLSRLIWYIVGHYAHYGEKYFSMKQILLFELCFFPLLWASCAYFQKPWIVVLFVATVIGYKWGRSSVMNSYIFKNFANPNYRATVLSMKSQIQYILQILFIMPLAYTMGISMRFGYAAVAGGLFLMLLVSYIFFIAQGATNSLRK